MINSKIQIESADRISNCGKYRYSLSRIWDKNKPVGMFVCMNPSIATAIVSDNTMCNCNNLAVKWGWGGFYIVNLFAYRATDPKEMKNVSDPVGKYNDKIIKETAEKADAIVLAWGNGNLERAADVKKILKGRKLYCLAKNKGGGYKHPGRIKVEEYKRPVLVK